MKISSQATIFPFLKALEVATANNRGDEDGWRYEVVDLFPPQPINEPMIPEGAKARVDIFDADNVLVGSL